MAAKRFFDDFGTNPDQQNGKRMKNKPSLASVVGEVVMVNFLQNFCTALEPVLRKVVHEEVENGLRRECSRSFARSPSFQIQSLEPSNLQLTFSKDLSLPIFTGSKIVGIDNSPLQILLVDTTGDQLIPTSPSSPLKIEIVVLDGDFPPGRRETWTSEEFNRNVVKERSGKRPLLAGELQVTMRDGIVSVGEIEFTDNSSWIRSRKFRIGARVVVQGGGKGVRVREAMTQAFVVKDHRGELYKKHHPPMLDDEVWRLEKIGKEGAFHKKLAGMGVTTVQEFLKLSVVEPSRLKKILGAGMSEKMWEATLKHARTCVMGSKLYISRGPSHFLILNPICQVVKAVINGQTYATRDLPTMINRAYVENLVREAYLNWHSLEEVDGVLNEVPLLTQGDVEEYPNHQQSIARQYQQHDFLTDGSNEVNYVPNSANMECNNWLLNSSTYFGSSSETGVRYSLSETSSDDHELTPVKPFIHED